MEREWIGYRWLAGTYNISPVQPFAVSTCIGKSRGVVFTDGITRVTLTQAARPEATSAAHLTFALKHEGVHLEFLARLFAVIPQIEIEQWIQREPSGQYARRACFLYEWLTGRSLAFDGVTVGNYVSALPDEQYVTNRRPENCARWRVRNNLPGNVFYCPTIRRTEKIKAVEQFDFRAQLAQLEGDFGTDILLRSAVWLTIKESRASFRIEHEELQADRIRRFAVAMERFIGKEDDPLSPEFLEQIQKEILGGRALRIGVRRSPVFVGETNGFDEFIHYVAPHWDAIPAMLSGLSKFAASTAGQPSLSLIRAGVLSFGFVFLHPMADGNGRISRFLINDTLRRDDVTPDRLVLPVSASIIRSASNLAAYNIALEQYSEPMMQKYRTACGMGAEIVCEDGVRTNFEFTAYADASSFWAYPDLTAQCEYLGGVIQETLQIDMRREASELAAHLRLRALVKEIVEAPDNEIDRIIRSVQDNGRTPTGKLKREYPIFTDDALFEEVANAVLGEGS